MRKKNEDLSRIKVTKKGKREICALIYIHLGIS